MRILLVTMHYAPSMGGLEKQSAALCQELVRRGHTVRVLTERLPGTESDEVRDGIAVHRVPALPNTRRARFAAFGAAAVAYAARHRAAFDLVHVQQILPPAAAIASALLLIRRPIVVTNHGSGQFGGVKLMQRLPLGPAALKLLGRRTTCVALTEEMQGEMRDAGMGEARLIPNGIALPPLPTEQERASSRIRLGISGRVILFVARLEPGKDVELLTRAFTKVRDDLECSLVIVGDGPEAERLREMAAGTRFASDIHFVGRSDDVRSYLAAADVFALATHSEGLSMALLEALGAGLPTVASDVGGNRQVISDASLGRLTAPGDVDAFAAALKGFLIEPVGARATGLKARAHVERFFSVEAMTDAYESLYKSLVA